MDSSESDGYSDSPAHSPAAPSSNRSTTWRTDMPIEPAAYSVENFEPRPPEELVCTVCRGVYRDPVECPCRHVFCYNCIRDWLARGSSPGSGSCPMCRQDISASQVVPVVPLVTNMIARLMVRCPNRETGCEAKVAMESLNCHLDTCQFRQVQCSDCAAPMAASELFRHQRESCSKRMVRCRRDCGLSLRADTERDHDCVRQMRDYITTLEGTLDILRQQMEYTLQQLSHVNRQMRHITARMEAFSAREPEEPEAPATPRSPVLGPLRCSQQQGKHLPGRSLFESGTGTSASGPSSIKHTARSSVSPSHKHRWEVPTAPAFCPIQREQNKVTRQSTPPFELFSDHDLTANVIHGADRCRGQSRFGIYMPPETGHLNEAAFVPFTEPLSNASSSDRCSGQQPPVFTFGEENTSEPPLTPNMSSATFRMAPLESAMSIRLREVTVSELVAGADPPTVSLSASANTTAPGGAQTSTSIMDLTTELASELRLNQTASGSGVTGGWQTITPDSFAMQADDLTASFHTMPSAHVTQANPDDTGILYGQFNGGDGYFSSFMQRMRENDGQDDDSDSTYDG
ncbi:uncharacterized protein [Dermacentor andersoni]|uniref:uncharacterized protein n=1 Tax=Dermacentor andersoni TaxID=34620 RepID=UPI002416F675|nr:uncharacterized protein LOC126529958 [Dermacentor andersoni]